MTMFGTFVYFNNLFLVRQTSESVSASYTIDDVLKYLLNEKIKLGFCKVGDLEQKSFYLLQ